MAKMIRISARRAGYRRAGIAFTTTPTDYPVDKFTATQLKNLQSDSGLMTCIIDPAEQAKIAKDIEAAAKAEAAATAAKTQVAADQAAAGKPAGPAKKSA